VAHDAPHLLTAKHDYDPVTDKTTRFDFFFYQDRLSTFYVQSQFPGQSQLFYPCQPWMLNWEASILVDDHFFGKSSRRINQGEHSSGLDMNHFGRKRQTVARRGPQTIAMLTSIIWLTRLRVSEEYMTRFHEFINQQTSRASPCTSRQALRVWGTPRVRFNVFLPNSAVTPRDTKLTAGPRRCVSRATAVHCAAGRWLGSKDDGWGGSSKLVCFFFHQIGIYIYV
jgi:hypothetical protein